MQEKLYVGFILSTVMPMKDYQELRVLKDDDISKWFELNKEKLRNKAKEITFNSKGMEILEFVDDEWHRLVDHEKFFPPIIYRANVIATKNTK